MSKETNFKKLISKKISNYISEKDEYNNEKISKILIMKKYLKDIIKTIFISLLITSVFLFFINIIFIKLVYLAINDNNIFNYKFFNINKDLPILIKYFIYSNIFTYILIVFQYISYKNNQLKTLYNNLIKEIGSNQKLTFCYSLNFLIKNYIKRKLNKVMEKIKNNRNRVLISKVNEKIEKSEVNEIMEYKNKVDNILSNDNLNYSSENNLNIKTFNGMSVLLGFDKENKPIFLKNNGLFQNLLITGSIGSGKTSSSMYPITKQLISHGCYQNSQSKEKIGMLILDVKGNYFNQVLSMAKEFKRDKDIIKVDIAGNFRYNPLDKKELSPSVLADRLKTILLLFSPNNSESFWLDKAEQLISEAIKFIRLYNDDYVNFEELHNIINREEYYKEKLKIIKRKIYNNEFSEKKTYEFNSFIDFFKNEYLLLDERTRSILKSEISRMTQIFVSDYNVNKNFSPPKEEINFYGFKEVIEKGKIVVLNMNISEYTILSKIIATYLKLDFHSEILQQLKNNKKNIKATAFICDEYQEYVSASDAKFYAQSREAKCINVVSTQSITSLKEALKSDDATKVITQSMVNKIWYRCDDPYTIEDAKKLIGQEEKERKSITISENAKDSNYSYILNKFISTGSNISESFNSYYQKEDVFDYNDFSQRLNVFEAIAFLSDGDKIFKPQKLKMIPYFLNEEKQELNSA